MSYQTVVAAFYTAAHAQAAVDALKAGGFHSDDISVFDKNRLGMRESGLWQRMLIRAAEWTPRSISGAPTVDKVAEPSDQGLEPLAVLMSNRCGIAPALTED